jgi:hypothetical protein
MELDKLIRRVVAQYHTGIRKPFKVDDLTMEIGMSSDGWFVGVHHSDLWVPLLQVDATHLKIAINLILIKSVVDS